MTEWAGVSTGRAAGSIGRLTDDPLGRTIDSPHWAPIRDSQERA